MNFTEIFGIWIAIYTILFCLVPIGLCIEWYKRGSSDGFSSVTFSLVATSIALWLGYGLMLEDTIAILINGIALVLFTFYLIVFGIYQTNRSNFYLQCSGSITLLLSTWLYVHSIAKPQEALATMGSISSTFQIMTFAGFLYEIYRVLFDLKTTEYLKFEMTVGGFATGFQWWIFGLLHNDIYIQRANVVGMIINAMMFALYFFYPPQTWTLPWQRKTTDEKEHKKEE